MHARDQKRALSQWKQGRASAAVKQSRTFSRLIWKCEHIRGSERGLRWQVTEEAFSPGDNSPSKTLTPVATVCLEICFFSTFRHEIKLNDCEKRRVFWFLFELLKNKSGRSLIIWEDLKLDWTKCWKTHVGNNIALAPWGGLMSSYAAPSAIPFSFKTKQNLIASLVNEVDQNQSWTTAEQFRSNLSQFVPFLWGGCVCV